MAERSTASADTTTLGSTRIHHARIRRQPPIRSVSPTQQRACAVERPVAHTSALVLDLRECRGGAPEGAAMWCSHFFPDDRVHLHGIYDRPTGATRQFWTTAHLPAPRGTGRPVRVPTGPTRFSGGEDVARSRRTRYERRAAGPGHLGRRSQSSGEAANPDPGLRTLTVDRFSRGREPQRQGPR
ncbi:hypothetical protein GT204_34590 [Streptomyces sp. SID4919]|nr:MULTISPECIES: S41 family peptidase [unclassified Streptomyces]MYY13857.1 hypothetical protein [Streptomyces sp. SID4919]